MEDGNVRELVKAAIEEFLKATPETQTALEEEKRRREELERKVTELTTAKEEAERGTTIRSELQRMGVAKIELAYRAVREETRTMTPGSPELREYLAQFVAENPELLPARMTGGSGAAAGQRGVERPAVEIEKIRPGMSAEELDRVRQEIARALRGG
jgi:hypothetical protein